MKKKKKIAKSDNAWWYNFHTKDSWFAHSGMYMNMLAMAFWLKTLASDITGFWSFCWWTFLLVANIFGIYWGRCNINVIEEKKLDLVMENL
jgi:hypothetical protein